MMKPAGYLAAARKLRGISYRLEQYAEATTAQKKRARTLAVNTLAHFARKLFQRHIHSDASQLPRWSYRMDYIPSEGYVVWRDVFEGEMKCSKLDAILAHKEAVFVLESEAIWYCSMKNNPILSDLKED